MKKLLIIIMFLISGICSAQSYELGQDLTTATGETYGQVFGVIPVEDGTLIYICLKQMMKGPWSTLVERYFSYADYTDWHVANSYEIKMLTAWKNGEGGQIHGWYGCASWVWTCEQSFSNPWTAYCYHLQQKKEGLMFKTTSLYAILVRMIEIKNKE